MGYDPAQTFRTTSVVRNTFAIPFGRVLQIAKQDPSRVLLVIGTFFTGDITVSDQPAATDAGSPGVLDKSWTNDLQGNNAVNGIQWRLGFAELGPLVQNEWYAGNANGAVDRIVWTVEVSDNAQVKCAVVSAAPASMGSPSIPLGPSSAAGWPSWGDPLAVHSSQGQ